ALFVRWRCRQDSAAFRCGIAGAPKSRSRRTHGRPCLKLRGLYPPPLGGQTMFEIRRCQYREPPYPTVSASTGKVIFSLAYVDGWVCKKNLSFLLCSKRCEGKKKDKVHDESFHYPIYNLVIRCKHRVLPEMCKRYVSFGDVSYDTKASNLMGGRRPLRQGIATIFQARVPSMECCRSPSRRQ